MCAGNQWTSARVTTFGLHSDTYKAQTTPKSAPKEANILWGAVLPLILI